MNINLERLEDSSYYLKKLAEEYQTLIFEGDLNVLNFGITWTRIHKGNNIKESAVDHEFTNSLKFISNHYKTQIDYSDHSMICVDLITKLPKSPISSTTSRILEK